MKDRLHRIYNNMRPIILVFSLLFALSSTNEAFAWGCNGDVPGTTCFSKRGLPGTCDENRNCIENHDPDGTCTTDKEYIIDPVTPGSGLVSSIINTITINLKPLAQQIFQKIMVDTGFQKGIIATMTLYVIAYAITFIFGIAQLTVFDFLIRIFKLGVVAMLITGNIVDAFSKTFIHFFNDGTDNIIAQVSTMASGGTVLGGWPFDWMDQAIVELTSPKMLVTILATFSTGIYGYVIVFVFIMSMYIFIKAMLNAIWIYLFSLTMRTLLLGLAPLFLACILFSRTRQLFDGWLNQIVNSCLQPIFLFAFFSFFMMLIKAGLDQLLTFPVCWAEVPVTTGSPDMSHYWRFTSGGVPLSGNWGIDNPPPIALMLPLTIWLMADLAQRAIDVVIQVAKDIANASTSFEFRGQLFGGKPAGGSPGGAPAATKPPSTTLNAGAPKPADAASRAEAVRKRKDELVTKRRTPGT